MTDPPPSNFADKHHTHRIYVGNPTLVPGGTRHTLENADNPLSTTLHLP